MKKKFIYILMLIILFSTVVCFGIRQINAFRTMSQNFVQFSERTDLISMTPTTYVGRKLSTKHPNTNEHIDGWAGGVKYGPYTIDDYKNIWCVHYQIPKDNVTEVKDNYDMLITSCIDMSYDENKNFFVKQYDYKGNVKVYDNHAAFLKLVYVINKTDYVAAGSSGYRPWHRNRVGRYLLANECNIVDGTTIRGLSKTENGRQILDNTEMQTLLSNAESYASNPSILPTTSVAISGDKILEMSRIGTTEQGSATFKFTQSNYLNTTTKKPNKNVEVTYTLVASNGTVLAKGNFDSFQTENGAYKNTVKGFDMTDANGAKLIVNFTQKVDVARIFIVENSSSQQRSVVAPGTKKYTETIVYTLQEKVNLDVNGEIMVLEGTRNLELSSSNTKKSVKEVIEYSDDIVNIEEGDTVFCDFEMYDKDGNPRIGIGGFDVIVDDSILKMGPEEYITVDAANYNVKGKRYFNGFKNEEPESLTTYTYKQTDGVSNDTVTAKYTSALAVDTIKSGNIRTWEPLRKWKIFSSKTIFVLHYNYRRISVLDAIFDYR